MKMILQRKEGCVHTLCWAVVITFTLTLGCSKKDTLSKAGPGAPPEIDLATPLPSPLPDIVARVNGQPVPLRNVKLLAEEILSKNHSKDKSKPEDQRTFTYRHALNQFIVRELLFQEAMNRKLMADNQKLEQAENDVRAPYKDEKAWATFLATQGLDAQSFKTELRIQHTVQALVRQESEKNAAPIDDAAAKTFYDANPSMFDSGERLRASHILIRVPPDTINERKDAMKTKAEGILARARSGEDFEKLAREFSQDVGTAGKGGQLDVFAHGQMTSSFEETAYAMKPGQVSNVVESPFGFHIIKLHERLPPEKLVFDQVKEQVKQYIAEKRRGEALQQLVTSLKAKAKIETFI